MGEKVKTIDMGVLSSGSQLVELDRNALANGVYLVTLNINNKLITKKIIVE